MTRQEFEEWSDRETNRLEITDYERELIKAYQINKAIDKLFATGLTFEAEKLERKFFWIKRLKDDFHKVDEAIKHLTDVCNYVKNKYDVNYTYEWLLSWDTTLYNLVLEDKEKKKIWDSLSIRKKIKILKYVLEKKETGHGKK